MMALLLAEMILHYEKYNLISTIKYPVNTPFALIKKSINVQTSM